MQQIALLVFLAGSLSQLSEAQDPTYGDGICSGTICAQVASSGQIQCIQDPEAAGSHMEVFSETYVEAGSGNNISHWIDVAINPLDGTIYVIYQVSSPVDFLGTIVDPLTLPGTGPYEVTPIGALTTDRYNGMTFDCEGNLYGINWATNVYQFDYNSNTNIDTLVDSLNSCGASIGGIDCTESLFYNFQDEIFYRISSTYAQQDVFFTQNTIDGADIPTDGTDMSGAADLCGGKGSLLYIAAFYIGNELSIISCKNDDQIYLLSGTPGSPTVTIISNSDLDQYLHGGADGLWNYNDNGDICKPPSCTKPPTFNPTKIPTDNPSKSPSKASAIPTINPTNIPSQSSINTVTFDSSEEAWLEYQSRKQEHEPALNNLHQIYEYIIIGFISLMFLILITAKYTHTNDYLRIGAIIVMLIGTVNVISDCFFISQVHIKNKIELNASYEIIKVIAIICIVVASLISFFQMHNNVYYHWSFKDHLHLWISNNSVFLLVLSILTGNALSALYLVNSSIYGLSLFHMGLTYNELNIFGCKRIYSIAILENIPLLCFQIYYLISSKDIGLITASSVVFSLISIMMSIVFIYYNNNKQYETVFMSMDVTGDCMETKSKYITMSKNYLQQLVAQLFNIDKNMFEIIKPVYYNYQNGVALKIVLYTNGSQADIDHQKILIEANNNGKLSKLFQNAWNLSDEPQITNIVCNVRQTTIKQKHKKPLNTDIQIAGDSPIGYAIELAEMKIETDMINTQDDLDTSVSDTEDSDSKDESDSYSNKKHNYENTYLKVNEYCQIFQTKPLGLIFGKNDYFGQQDNKNLYVTGIDDIGDKNKENVIIGSKIVKLQEEYVQDIGYKQIYKLFTDKYVDILPLKITFIKPNKLHVNDKNVYCVIFEKKPLGFTMGKVKTDNKNLFVTAVDKDGIADKANVIVGSKIIKFEEEVVENLGFMKIFQIFADKYSYKIPLKVTFRNMNVI